MDNITVCFTKEKTNICKGIAALMLVIHHLFYLKPELPVVGKIGEGVPYYVALAFRVCVTIFTILSGYGIEKSVHCENVNCKYFYKTRLKKFYLNYLSYVVFSLVFMLFSGVLAEKASDGKIFILRLLLSLSGTHYLIKNLGINIVWWYATMLMCCYISFPFINRIVLKKPNVITIISIIFVSAGQISINRIGIFEILSWMGVFYIGCVLSCNNTLEKIADKFDKKRIVPIICIVAISILRMKFYNISLVTRYLDLLFAIFLMICILLTKNITNSFWRMWIYLGQISMGIYYIHYLWIAYTKTDLIYMLPNSIVMIIVTMLLTILSHYIFNYSCLAIKKVDSMIKTNITDRSDEHERKK